MLPTINIMAAMLAFVACACAQTSPAIEAVGRDLKFTVPRGGRINIEQNGQVVPLFGSDATAINAVVASMQAQVATLVSEVASLQSWKTEAEACNNAGQLYSSTTGRCVSPQGPNGQSLVDRINNLEDDVMAIEDNLNGTNGSHQFCTICPRNNFVSTPCDDHTQTQCSACPAGTYSNGGFATSCIACASQIDGCQYATCTNRNDAQCQVCQQSVESFGQQALILTNPTNCDACPVGQYRNSNSSCQTCAKPDTCGEAQCQPVYRSDNNASMLTGLGALSSVYTPGLLGQTLEQYLRRAQDGVTTWPPQQLHTNTESNPWYSFDMGNGISAVDRIVLYNRGNSACRLFGLACTHGTPIPDGPTRGFFLGLSDNDFANGGSPNTRVCSSSVTRNCICQGKILTPNNVGNRYEVNCNGATGRYAYVYLPRTNNGILNFDEFQVYGWWNERTSAQSVCNQDCASPGCQSGRARCSGGMSTAVCPSDGCIQEISDGVAWGFDSGSRTCRQCSASQYRNGQGVCASCPNGCSNCQVQNDLVNVANPMQGPGTYADLVPSLSIDDSMTTYSETGFGRNPFLMVDMNGAETVSRVSISNRPDACGSRLFNGNRGCPFAFAVPGGAADRDFDGPGEGATIRVSDTPCPGDGTDCPGTVCGRLVRPSYTSHTYVVECNQSISGRYVSIQLPSLADRILQIADIKVYRDSTQPQCP